MATVNRESVREEAERIKSEFARLSEGKKINSECRVLLQSMLMLINLLIAIFLEKTTAKHTKNSSKPSSQTEKDDQPLLTSVVKVKARKNLMLTSIIQGQ